MSRILIDEVEEVVLYKNMGIESENVLKVAPAGGDEFDPYIGVALAYCYQIFGGKKEFRRFVDDLRKEGKMALRHRVYKLPDGEEFEILEDEHGWI